MTSPCAAQSRGTGRRSTTAANYGPEKNGCAIRCGISKTITSNTRSIADRATSIFISSEPASSATRRAIGDFRQATKFALNRPCLPQRWSIQSLPGLRSMADRSRSFRREQRDATCRDCRWRTGRSGLRRRAGATGRGGHGFRVATPAGRTCQFVSRPGDGDARSTTASTSVLVVARIFSIFAGRWGWPICFAPNPNSFSSARTTS